MDQAPLKRYPSSMEGLDSPDSLTQQSVASLPGTPSRPSLKSTAESGKKFKAVILIGGPSHGTRFRPLTLRCAKPLFPIAGQAMVAHHIAALAKVEGLIEILLIGVYPDSHISEFVHRTSRDLKIPIRYLPEYTSLGTAGGLYFFRDQIKRGNPDFFFVLHSDICVDLPIHELIAFHDSSNAHTIMSVKGRKEETQHYGCIVTQDEDTLVSHYVEKPHSFISNDISCGVYVFGLHVFDTIAQCFLAHFDSSAEKKDEISMERDVLPQIVSVGQLRAYKCSSFWSQIKTAAGALYANRHYLAVYDKALLAHNQEDGPRIKGDVLIHHSASVHPSALIGPNVTLGSGVRVGAGARIRDAIILDNAVLEDHCCVLNAIVGWDSIIGQWCRVEGHAVGVNPNDPTTHDRVEPLFTKDGRLNPSITILGEGCHIASELVVLNSIVLPHKEITSSYKNEIIL